jgi:hypothetical protein
VSSRTARDAQRNPVSEKSKKKKKKKKKKRKEKKKKKNEGLCQLEGKNNQLHKNIFNKEFCN